MILDCPSCHARFMVADALIPPAGRTVKCGKCAFQWHAEAAPVSAAAMPDVIPPPEVKPLPEFVPQPTAKVPAKKPWSLPVKPFKWAAPVLATAWAVLAVFAYFPSWENAAVVGGIYRTLGVVDTEGLVFTDMNMERVAEENVTRFVLSGSIANHSDKPRVVPHVRVQLKDKKGKVISMRNYKVNETVKAGEVYPFRIDDVKTTFIQRTASLVVDMGNSFELSVR